MVSTNTHCLLILKKAQKYHICAGIVFLAVLFFGCSGSRRTNVDIERERRIKMEMTSIIEMVRSREIPPIEFEFNSAKLLETSFNMLDRITDILLRYPNVKLVVHGHTDYIGSAEYNKKLSNRRAKSVKVYLVKSGIHPTDIRTYGFGKERPIIRDKSDRGRALNRRVEFKITTREWEAIY